LRTIKLPSEKSTFCFDPSVRPPVSPEAQRGVLLRILRYVSPLPWGSPRAEAGRRTERLDRIRSEIWASTPLKAFSLTVGGQVLWSYYPKRRCSHHDGPVWMASRLPPARGVSTERLEIDLTDIILNNRNLDELWDSRFRIKFCSLDAPDNMIASLRKSEGALCIVPHGKFCIPRLTWKEWDGSKARSRFVGEGTEAKFKLPENALHAECIRELDDL
jgi:tRNA(Ile)-lysidine synthase